jgi:sigma-B regulation protein RsbU (phosphoserine phosphatase)
LEGYQVELVNNGLKASSRALEETFDLILLDVMIPGKNGFDVCRDLRRSGRDVPIIFLTAKSQEGDRVDGLDLGANDYVTKPFSPRELMARVRRLLQFVETNRQDRKHLEDELDAAAKVQQRLLPSSLPRIPGFDYAGLCQPARGVSGDYFDFLSLPSGRLALLLADACGKGMPAALLAASVHAAVRAFAPAADRKCGEVVSQVNRLLFETTAAERFVTLFYAVYDPTNHALTWANAGHCPPLWMRSTGECVRLDSLTTPAGMMPAISGDDVTIRLDAGDRLVIVSDGVLEASNASGEEFGESRLLQLVRDTRRMPASSVCSTILTNVKEFSRDCSQGDDLTVVVLGNEGPVLGK